MAMNGNPVLFADPSGADSVVYGMAGESANANQWNQGHSSFGNASYSAGGIFWGTEKSLWEQSWEGHESTYTGSEARDVFAYYAIQSGWSRYGIIYDCSWATGGKGGGFEEYRTSFNGSSFIKDKIGGFAFATDLKVATIEATQFIKGAELAKGVEKYLRLSKTVGIVGDIAMFGYGASETYEQYEKGGYKEVFEHRSFIDVGVGGVGLYAALAMTGPAGWTVGAVVLVYTAGTLIWDANHQP
jgi:hypothetical protein